MESAALIDACSNFVAQLDAHQVGAAIVLCIIVRAAVCVVVVALAVTLLAATRSKRGRRVDNGRQNIFSVTRRGRQ
ncbi:hypothetical protein [Burkholderia pseudomallei]